MGLSERELDDIEQQLGVVFPFVYRKALAQRGPGKSSDNTEIYHPAEIRELYEPFFDDPAELFTKYFPIGCDNSTQELWVVDVERNLVAAISHETVTDDWPEEEWQSYEQWTSSRSN